MTEQGQTQAISGTIVNLQSLSANFPQAPDPEVLRDNIVQTLVTLLQGGVYCVAVEGSEGVGKTTVLSHFARRFPDHAISIFISAANRLSYDHDLIRSDIASQVYWACSGSILELSQNDPGLLKVYYSQLQHKAKQRKVPYYFIIDGIDELPQATCDVLLRQLADILPIGIPQFRFLFAGDETLYRDLFDKRLVIKSFPLTEFGIEEVRALFAQYDLSPAELKDINLICRGLPGRLCEVLRAVQKGMTPRAFIEEACSKWPEFFEIDWKQVDPGNDDQLRILALLTHDSKPHSIDDISEICDLPKEQVRKLIAMTNFLIIESCDVDVRFVSPGLRKYAAEQLKSRKSGIQKLLIKRLLASPGSDSSILDLPEYMEDAAQYADLLDILTPDHILHVLERSQTLSRVEDAVKRGLRSASKLGRDGDILRFGLQASIILDLASSNIWESEVAALVALDREAEATTLATSAILREDRLQMLATLVHNIWLKGTAVPPELVDQIGLLIDNLDYWSLGRRAVDIASKLVCVNPGLAMTLLQKAKWVTGDEDLDRTFEKFAALALRDVRDEDRLNQAIETAMRSRPNPKAGGMLEGFRVLTGRLSPTEVCKRLNDIGEYEAQISTLRYWCVLNGQVQDADLVATRGLKLALANPSTRMDAGLLADFSLALAGAPSVERITSLISTLDGLRATAERLGPSIDYVRLQLSIAQFETRIDAVAAEGRLVQLLDYVSKISALPTRGEAYAQCLAALETLSEGISQTLIDELRSKCSSELELVVLTISESTADHHRALGGIISALASGDLEKAIDYTRVVNTEARRDAVFADVIDKLLRKPIPEIQPTAIFRVYKEIIGPEKRDEALNAIFSRFSDAKTPESKQIGDLVPLISELPKAEDSMVACRSLVRALKLVRGEETGQFSSLESELKTALRTRWQSIDRGWSRIDAGYGIARDLTAFDKQEAEETFKETESLKAEGKIAAAQNARTYTACLLLMVRAYCGLLSGHHENDIDLKTIAALVDILPSCGDRALIWADLCMRASLAGRSELAETVCSERLEPAFSMVSDQDIDYKAEILVRIAPALYRSQPAMCLDALEKLYADQRDAAILEIIRFLLRRHVPYDPYDRGTRNSPETNYETLLQIESLTKRLNTDWMIYLTSEEVADAITSPKNRYTLTRPQCEDIGRRFADIAKDKLPIARHISHNGYRLATLAQAYRMTQPKQAIWNNLISEAEHLGNIADRALVLQIVAIALPKNMSVEFARLLERVQEDITQIPWKLDQVNRLLGLAEDLNGVDSIRCKALIAQLSESLAATGDDMQRQRRQLVDLAFSVDEEIARKMIDTFDDDDAKKIARSQLQLLEARKAMANLQKKPEQERIIKHLQSAEVSKLGAMLLRAVSSGRVQHFHPSEIREYLDLAANQPMRRAYALFSWYVENAVARYSETDQAEMFLRPMFEACLLSARLTAQISGKSLIRLKALKQQSSDLSLSQSKMITPKSRGEALALVLRWCEKSLGEHAILHDQYFGPNDLEWIQLIRTAKPDITITVITSRRHQPPLEPGEELEDLYLKAWFRLYDQAPPKAEIAVIGGEKSKDDPIHDRWLVSGGSGLRFGTSLNSLGITKDSEISEMSINDAEQKANEVEQYLSREKTEHNGEKLRLARFWL